MSESSKKQTRGGKRAGSGRPKKFTKGKATTISLMIEVDLLQKIDQSAEEAGKSRSDLIRECLLKSFS